jgi:hypothetical protein
VPVEGRESLSKPIAVDFAKHRLQLGALAHYDAFPSRAG